MYRKYLEIYRSGSLIYREEITDLGALLRQMNRINRNPEAIQACVEARFVESRKKLPFFDLAEMELG